MNFEEVKFEDEETTHKHPTSGKIHPTLHFTSAITNKFGQGEIKTTNLIFETHSKKLTAFIIE